MGFHGWTIALKPKNSLHGNVFIWSGVDCGAVETFSGVMIYALLSSSLMGESGFGECPHRFQYFWLYNVLSQLTGHDEQVCSPGGMV